MTSKPSRTSTEESLETPVELNALIADYQIHRDDERQFPLAIGALVTIFAAIVFAEATQIFQSCSLNSGDNCVEVPGVVYALAPAPVYAVLSLIVILGSEATLRYAYMLALESEIQARLKPLQLEALRRPLSPFKALVNPW